MTFFIRSVLAALPILLFLGGPAWAATYYVSPSGADSNSCATAQSNTAGKQKRTIAAGVACLTAGDTLYIRGGTYTGSANRIDSQAFSVASGTASARITISAASGEVVEIQPPRQQGCALLNGPSYLTIKNIKCNGANSQPNVTTGELLWAGSNSNHLRFEDNEFYNFPAVCVLHGSPFFEFVKNKVHHCGNPSGEVNSAYGIYVTAADGLYDGNEVYANNGYGFHVYAVSPTNHRNVIRNNRIYENGTGGGPNFGIVVAQGDDIQIYNNLIYRNRGGILVYTNTRNAQVYNNTVYQNGEGIVLQYYSSAPTVRNNIVFNNGAGIVNHGGTGTPVTSNNLTADPRFVNAASNDFHLQSGSAAEDAGVTVTSVRTDFAGVSRPQGSAYDIGAYEIESQRGGPPSKPRKLKVVGP